MLLKGEPVADLIKNEIIDSVKKRKIAGLNPPKLALIRIGSNPDDIAYEDRILGNCNTLGILAERIELNDSSDTANLLNHIYSLNVREDINGILLFRPLPDRINNEEVSKAIKWEKDIDSMGSVNLAKVFADDNSALAPCTPEAVVELLRYYFGDLTGKNIVVVNRSLVLGKPLSMLLLRENTTVTICHSRTVDLWKITSKADIVVTGVGRGKYFGKKYFSQHSIVIDVGINFIDGKMCGDVDFEAVEKEVKAITPVPGGVGTVTSVILLRNIVKGMALQEDC